MVRERLDHWCENGILVLVLAVLAFGPLATGAVRPWEFLVIHALTMAAVSLWLFRFWLHSKHRLFWPPVCWAVVAFVVFAIVRYSQADIEYVARQELIRVLVYASLFFVILNNLARQESAQLLAFVVVFLGMAISMYAIYQFATNSEYVWHFIKPANYRHRASGTYICPNHLAGFLEMLVPLGLAFALTSRVGHVLRVLLGYASLVMLAGIGITFSRGGWLATTLALLLFFILLIRRQHYRIPAILAAILVVTTVAFFGLKTDRAQKRFNEIFSAESADSAEVRFRLWRPTFLMWQDHFWLGVGPGHFDYRFPLYRPPEVQLRPGHAHNDYLNTLADWGVVGSTVVASALVLLYLGVFKTWKYVSRSPGNLGGKSSSRTAFVFGASLGLAALLVHSLTDFNMHIPANAILAVSLMALLSGYCRFATEGYWIGLRLPGRLLLTLVGVTGLFFSGQQAWRRAHEYLWLERSAREQSFSTTKINALKQALAAEPMNPETAYELGEALRRVSWQGDAGYEKLAEQAIHWFQQGIRINPYNAYNFMRIGMCLDWLGRQGEAAPYFEEAVKRDPNNHYVLAHQGWHFFQTGDYVAAKRWFERSVEVHHIWNNPIARNYLAIIERKAKESEKK